MADSLTSSVPRRCDLRRFIPAERAIWDAKWEVEHAGGHPLLTEALVLLGQAQDKVADLVDEGFWDKKAEA